jgi:hypothetical protein
MDDKFHRNRKVRALRKLGKEGRIALGVWTFWWSWCLDDPELSGLVPSSELSPTDQKAAKTLCEVGLWFRAEGGGFGFHDFHEYNPTKDQVDAKRLADRERVAANRRGSRKNVATDTAATIERRRIHARSPVPSRPDQGEKSAPCEPTLGASTTPHPSRLIPLLLEATRAEAFKRNVRPAPSVLPSQQQTAAKRAQELLDGGTFSDATQAVQALVVAAYDLAERSKKGFGLALLDATVAAAPEPFRDNVLPWGRV